MKFASVISACLVCICISINSKAQGTYSGCFLPGTNVLYQSEYQTTGYFSSKQGVTPLSNGYCFWRQTASSSIGCTVCTGPNSVTYNSSTGAFISCDAPVVGVRGTYTMVLCPIDNSIWLLLFPSIIVGFILLKRTKTQNLY